MSRLGSVWTLPPCAVPMGKGVRWIGETDARTTSTTSSGATHPQHQSIQPHQQIHPRSPQ